eukprot:Selendium_serpulae@DN4450_c1_g1_i1.p1
MSSRVAGRAARGAVPEVLAQFGAREQRTVFRSHPAVMMVARLLEMRHLVRPRAVPTAQNVEDIRKFDAALSQKVKIAVDNGLSINFQELEHLDRPEYLAICLAEKQKLNAIRNEVSRMAAGEYKVPSALEGFTAADPAPRAWRTEELTVPKEAFKVEPWLSDEVDVQDAVDSHVRKRVAQLAGSAMPRTPAPTAAKTDMLPPELQRRSGDKAAPRAVDGASAKRLPS